MNGTVKFFNQSKGFGFIAAEDGKEYFVHISGLTEGTKVVDNDSVSFDVEDGDRGPKAVNVSRADAAPATSVPPADDSEEESDNFDDEADDDNSEDDEAEDDQADDDSEDDDEEKTN